jgi:hypothetical protein
MYQEIYPGSKLNHFKVIHQVGGDVTHMTLLFRVTEPLPKQRGGKVARRVTRRSNQAAS